MNNIVSFFAAFMLIIASNQYSFAQKSYKASMDGWEVDLNVAYKKSQEKGIPILANFQVRIGVAGVFDSKTVYSTQKPSKIGRKKM